MKNKIDKVVLKETLFIATWTLIFSALLQSVFLIIGKWDLTVLLGNIYSDVAVIFNFFILGLSVQKAISKSPKDAQQFMKATASVRMIFIFAVTALGVALDCFNTWTVVIPLLFPRAAIMLRPFLGKKLDAEIAAMYVVDSNTDGTGQTTDDKEDKNEETTVTDSTSDTNEAVAASDGDGGSNDD